MTTSDPAPGAPAAAPAPAIAAPAALTPAQAKAAAKTEVRWQEHAPRTTAVLAVLAAVASGNYAGQFSRTILAQAEASDQWNFYQAKSIKRNLAQNQYDMAQAMSHGRPDLAEDLKGLQERITAKAKEYDQELKEIKANAERIEDAKRKHQKQGDLFQIAFVVLQAGVVLSTIASSARRKELWALALTAGVIGLLIVADGFLLVK